MSLRGFTAFCMALALSLGAIGWSAPAAAQETSGEYRQSLNGIHAEMNALTLEIENFRINARYCKPPGIPSKAEAQAALDELARRAAELNARYNALKQSLKDFARNPRVAAELMLRGIDPTDDRWFSSYEAARRRMLDALARKRAALAAAPEIDCTPKPKPKPPVTTGGGFQPPALPVRPGTGTPASPTLPSHFCSWDEYWKFIIEVINPIYNQAAEDAERVAKFRTEVEQAVNSYVQNNRPVPADLIARRRQAIADVEAANRRMRETEELRNRAKAIPVIDCRQPQTQPPAQDLRTGQATTPETPQWARGLSAIDERSVSTQERIIDGVEADLKALEEMARRRGACGALWDEADDIDYGLDELEEDEWFPPSMIREWRSRLDKIMDDCPVPRIAGPDRYQTIIPSQTGFLPPADPRMRIILDEHNKARAEVGSPPLQWDPALAAGAAAYAQQLTTLGRVHAPREGRKDIRENLLQSLRGQRSPREMVGVWIAERRNFVPGIFPNVSRTGNWADVGHWTQMVWPTTTRLGCAIHSDLRFDWTVCRYSPPGNRDGSPILMGPRQPVIAQDIAPPTSSTPTRPDLPMLPKGGGMTQIDPPPPPPPTARDDAPEGDEARHPLVTYFNDAFTRHGTAVDCGDALNARLELEKMRYALDELKKRLKAAKKAGPFSAVRPDDVQRQIEEMERKIRFAEGRRRGDRCPPEWLPPPPPPTERGL